MVLYYSVHKETKLCAWLNNRYISEELKKEKKKVFARDMECEHHEVIIHQTIDYGFDRGAIGQRGC